MKKILIACLVLFVLMACSKDKFQTKPQISIKTVTNSVVPINGSTTVILSYTDKEGDISDTLFYRKYRLNKTVVATVNDSASFKIPDFPNYDKGEINIDFGYQDILSAIKAPPIPGSNPVKYQPDTLTVKFWIRDKAKNVSDTVSTGIIVLRDL